jgi:hypothetical protein
MSKQWPPFDEVATECLRALYSYHNTRNPIYVKNVARVMLDYTKGADQDWWLALKHRAATSALQPADDDEATTRIRRMLGLEDDNV